MGLAPVTRSCACIFQMKILAHRGQWLHNAEKNSREALRLALDSRFGIETDLRDFGGRLVISHDPPSTNAFFVEDFFSMVASISFGETPLALNIKSDGLRSMLKDLLKQHSIENYFCFDMSFPETLAYSRYGLRYFTRQSEYEREPVLYADAAGVWMDMFSSDWITASDIARHLDAGKEVAIVSPELHGRPWLPFWESVSANGLTEAAGLMLCTDHPTAAQDFFHE